MALKPISRRRLVADLVVEIAALPPGAPQRAELLLSLAQIYFERRRDLLRRERLAYRAFTKMWDVVREKEAQRRAAREAGISK